MAINLHFILSEDAIFKNQEIMGYNVVTDMFDTQVSGLPKDIFQKIKLFPLFVIIFLKSSNYEHVFIEIHIFDIYGA